MSKPVEIIKITHNRYSCGFGKPERLQFDGVRFPNGKIVYMDEEESVYTVESEKELNKALIDAEVEVKEHE